MFGKLRGEAGITLVEMVISALILGLVLSTMIGTFIIARIGATKAKHRIEAVNLLRAKMEELKDSPYDDIVDEGPDPVSIDIGPDLERGTPDDLVGTQTVTVEDIDADPDVDLDGDGGPTNDSDYKEVTAELRWEELSWGGGSRAVSEELVTLISR